MPSILYRKAKGEKLLKNRVQVMRGFMRGSTISQSLDIQNTHNECEHANYVRNSRLPRCSTGKWISRLFKSCEQLYFSWKVLLWRRIPKFLSSGDLKKHCFPPGTPMLIWHITKYGMIVSQFVFYHSVETQRPLIKTSPSSMSIQTNSYFSCRK